MFIENRLAQLAARLRDTQPTPLRLSLWNGRSLDFGPDPKVTIVVQQKDALRCFLPPDLMKLGEAYVEGRIRVEGSLRDIFEASARFVRAAARPESVAAHPRLDLPAGGLQLTVPTGKYCASGRFCTESGGSS
jgi:cyclopropane-fatty-acyl-phospholipid synthase